MADCCHSRAISIAVPKKDGHHYFAVWSQPASCLLFRLVTLRHSSFMQYLCHLVTTGIMFALPSLPSLKPKAHVPAFDIAKLRPTCQLCSSNNCGVLTPSHMVMKLSQTAVILVSSAQHHCSITGITLAHFGSACFMCITWTNCNCACNMFATW